MSGCRDGAGSVRVKPDEVVGTYETQSGDEKERLELKSDRTYLQNFDSEIRSFHHTGKWIVKNHFLDYSEITLFDYELSESSAEKPYQRVVDMNLMVYKRAGKITLAVNGSADKYFEKTK